MFKFKKHGGTLGCAEQDEFAASRVLYIIEAALEYFISLMVTGAYLAKITTALGMSDSLTGILTSFVSLGCMFQLFALFFVNSRSVKRKVTILHLINQLCFTFIWLVPIVNISPKLKSAVFIVVLLSGHIIANIINSPKINWYMSLIDDNKRGSFTANKEIVSLIGGMLFTLFIGSVIDKYEASGNISAAFIFGSIALFLLTVFHTLTLIFSKEKPHNTAVNKIRLGNIIKNKKVLKVIFLAVLWNVATYASTPFFGSYQIKELGFSMLYVSVIGVVYSLVRALFSRLFGRYADRHSFIKMLNICYCIALAAFTVNIFTVPTNGKIFYLLYYSIYAVAMAGIGNGTLNLIYGEVETSQRMGAYALQNAFCGCIGFLTTVVSGKLVSFIQNSGNRFLGINVYAQQVVSSISAVVIIILLIYHNTVIKKLDKKL